MNSDGQKPAFPQYPSNYPTPDQGITIRDYFAATALQGLISSPEIIGPPERYAEYSYKYADAMLKARGEK